MNLRLRPLLALGALFFTAATASAQFIELLIESPVTFQVTLTTTATTTTATERKTTSTITRLTHAQVLEELRAAGIIPAPTITGWSLVAVRAAPADLYDIDGSFFLYAVNGATRILVPETKFKSSNFYLKWVDADGDGEEDEGELKTFDYGRVAKYSERHLGQYVLSSKGTVTVHSTYNYQPAVTVGTSRFTLDETLTDGFATIAYQAKDLSDGYEVFYFAPTSVRVTARGGFAGSVQAGQGPVLPTTGLISLTLTVGAPKLVPATLYPEIDYFYNPVSRY
jgi:hypothetical protein